MEKSCRWGKNSNACTPMTAIGLQILNARLLRTSTYQFNSCWEQHNLATVNRHREKLWSECWLSKVLSAVKIWYVPISSGLRSTFSDTKIIAVFRRKRSPGTSHKRLDQIKHKPVRGVLRAGYCGLNAATVPAKYQKTYTDSFDLNRDKTERIVDWTPQFNYEHVYKRASSWSISLSNVTGVVGSRMHQQID